MFDPSQAECAAIGAVRASTPASATAKTRILALPLTRWASRPRQERFSGGRSSFLAITRPRCGRHHQFGKQRPNANSRSRLADMRKGMNGLALQVQAGVRLPAGGRRIRTLDPSRKGSAGKSNKTVSTSGFLSTGDRGFESPSLHQRVLCEPDFLDQGCARAPATCMAATGIGGSRCWSCVGSKIDRSPPGPRSGTSIRRRPKW
jgi:hypothetical protein